MQLWPLLVLRTAVLIVSGAQQASIDPDNDYVTEQSDGEWRMFEQATSIPMDVMTAVIRAELGLAVQPGPVTVTAPLVEVDPASVVTLDLSTTSDEYDVAFEPDGSMRPGVEDEIARTAVQQRRGARCHPIRASAAEPDQEAQPGQPRRGADRHQSCGPRRPPHLSRRGTAKSSTSRPTASHSAGLASS